MKVLPWLPALELLKTVSETNPTRATVLSSMSLLFTGQNWATYGVKLAISVRIAMELCPL